MRTAHIYKTERKRDLGRDLEKFGFKVNVFALVLGAREFLGASAYYLKKQPFIGGNQRSKALRTLEELQRDLPGGFWARRNEMILHI